MFSHLNPINNPTLLPNATLTIGATARSPNYRGSHVYPNYRGSRTQPQLSGLLHATLAAACNPNGRGSRVRPGWGRRCAWALPLRHALRACGLRLCPCGSRYALADFILHCKTYMNSFIKRIHICMNSYI
jgi:hypothetical protein